MRLSIKKRSICCCVLLNVLLASDADPCAAANKAVTVRTTQGLTLTAAVDESTNDQQLTLRFDGNSASIARSIQWKSIEHVRYDGRNYSSSEFRGMAQDLGTHRSYPTPSAGNGSVAAGRTSKQQSGLLDSDLAAALPSNGRSMARTIVVDAYLAHWDADTEVDGLVLKLTVVDK